MDVYQSIMAGPMKPFHMRKAKVLPALLQKLCCPYLSRAKKIVVRTDLT